MVRTLLVTIDSLRTDHYEQMASTREYVGDGHGQAYATFPSTLGSFPAIVGGEYAVTSGLPDGTSVVPHLDRYSVGITTNHLLSPGYGYADGFDVFESPAAGGDSLREKVASRFEPGTLPYEVAAAGWNSLQRVRGTVGDPGRTFRPAEDVVETFLDHVDGHDEWFGWLHFMEPHHPYEPDEGPLDRVAAQNLTRRALSGRVDEDEATTVRELYRREVVELDESLEALWDAIPDDTEVVLLADHGELLGEDGIWGHPGMLRPELLHVPLATRNVDAEFGEVASLIDVPTALRGVPHGEGTLDREVAFASYGEERAAMDGNHLVTNEDEAVASKSLRNRLYEFDVESGVTRDQALDRDLEVLGYK
jgi:arylsulfatase A-like enzyme